ncbi:DEAD/DEAH box helicase [Neglectibacter timonensis]|jgi:superfamily II DNA or RNA helicase|uniref:DEAD/DEAH box helicase n=2 Tax=Clostridia TaxID=186801 RepID=A0A9D2SCR8_9FIRM|nr:DEAD/DEAH box helicase [Neglectibacter timonensis]MCQ4840290.1 DEAD/DEAH box helicase [Neglectibacter timonensis]MCQ4843872.1 DEAD/DEAH box helicase [Neglectibacter timonensis]DAL00334.1 MAG TPA: Chromatin remodeling complex ATPase [Caudoviricetes sp.]HJB90263.1 DEAD/DEAH box helicase [Candidatus Eisenbergiella merdigallinarum]
MFELRPYQAEAKQAILAAWDEGYRKTLLVLPTGCGKTVVFSSVTENQVNKGHRVLIMAHRGELLDQAADKLKEASGLDSVLEKAESTSLGSFLPVTVGSVQSLAQEKRLARFPNNYFQDIIVDEAHHCLSDSYKRVLDHFPNANILGVTATPDRGDMKNLGEFFDSKAYEYSMTEAIREGYLCPIKAQMIPLELDIADVGISSGDFSAGEIGHALEPYLHQIASEMANYCRGRKTVVFLPLIATSQKFCAMLNDAGLRAAEVNGNSDDRSEVLADFEAGKYDVLCNSMLLTEGWDCPSVNCIVVLRPTKIRSLYQQMVGRGMRLSPGKTELLLLDFLWMTERHDLCRPSALISKDEAIAKKIDERMVEDADGFDLIEAEEQAERDILAERESALAKQLAEMRGKKRKLVDPLQYALSIAAEDLTNYVPTFAWEMAPPSEKQIAFLERRGIFADSVRNAGLASLLIDRLQRRQQMGLATPKQIRCLERYGFRQVGTWAFEDASSLISRLADNSWRVPYGMTPALYRP